MKKYFRYLLLTILFLTGNLGIASHYKGIDAYYVCLGNGVYRIYLRVYGDCESTLDVDDPPGAGGLSEQYITIPANCSVPLGPWVKLPSPIPFTNPPDSSIYPDVTPTCLNANVTTQCTDATSPIPGTREIVFYRDFNLNNCSRFEVRFDNCCRNNSINNITNPGSVGIGYILVINRQLASCNSSPYFTERPIPYLCRNQLASINQGAVDPDGDSLVFRLCAPLTDTYTGVAFTPPLNFSNPFPAAFGAVFDPVTGTMTLTPTLNNWKGVFTVCVDEYRNGVLIGTISRDMQITVIDCNALAAAFGFGPQTPPFSTGMNGTGAFTDTVCVGTEIAFTVPAVDNDTDKVLISWNNGIPDATFNTSGFFLYNNVAYFSWVPTASGTYQFLVNVTDDHCPLSASNQFVFTIYVPPVLSANVSHIVQCNDAIFTTNITGGTPPYQFNWQSPAGNSNTQNPTFTFNGPGTYPVSVTITDSRNCVLVLQDTVEITPADGVFVDAGADISFCSGLPLFQLGSAPAPNQTYSWSPTTGLSNPTISNPTVSLNNTTSSPLTIEYVVTVTKFNCVITDTVVVTVYPIPTASISANAQAYCEGDTVRLSGPPNMASYSWSTGDTTQTIEFVATTSMSVSLGVADSSSCLSPVVSYFVNVTAPPTASIFAPDTICQGSSVTLTAFGASAYLWSDGSSGNTISDVPTVDGSQYWVIPFQNGCPGDTVFHTVYFYPTPVADIVPQNVPDQCIENNTFTFTASGGTSYFWDFGQGALPAVSVQQTETVTYLGPGVKTVKLVAYQNGCASDTVYRTFDINPMPKVTFNAPDPQCFAGHRFQFEAQGIWGSNPQFNWSFGPNATPQTSSQQNPTNVKFDQPGTYQVSLFVVENGCTSNVVTRDVIVYPMPDAPTVLTDSICEGYATIVYANTNDPNLIVEWYTSANGGVPFHTGYSYTTPQLNSNITYYLGTLNSDGCRSVTRTPLKILVYPSPTINVTLSEDTVSLPNAVVEFLANVPTNVKTWLWTFGDGSQSTNPNPVHQYLEEGEYNITLTVVDSNGCVNSIILNRFVTVIKTPRVYVPNAFTPNGDGINDEFYIVTNYMTSLQMIIHNRWNQLVFETNDLNFRWDGKDLSGKQCPEGVYSYLLKARNFDGTIHERFGTVTIIR